MGVDVKDAGLQAPFCPPLREPRDIPHIRQVRFLSPLSSCPPQPQHERWVFRFTLSSSLHQVLLKMACEERVGTSWGGSGTREERKGNRLRSWPFAPQSSPVGLGSEGAPGSVSGAFQRAPWGNEKAVCGAEGTLGLFRSLTQKGAEENEGARKRRTRNLAGIWQAEDRKQSNN